MPISASCNCGQAFKVKDALVGKWVKCPKCGNPFLIQPKERLPVSPAARDSGDLAVNKAEERNEVATEPCPACAEPMPQDKIVCVACGYSKRLGRKIKQKAIPQQKRRDPDPNEKKKTAKPRPQRPARASSNYDWTPILAGSAMMLGAVLWFGAGLLANRIFIYPPILFVSGLLTLIKGI